jgi:hypothetical protein
MNRNAVLLFVALAVVMSVAFAGVASAQASVRLFLEDGCNFNSQTVDPSSPEFTAEPGASVNGILVFRCENEDAADAVMEGTVTWEPDHANRYAFFGFSPQGTNHYSIPIDDMQCPPAGGTYYMVMGSFAAPDSSGYVASMTSPTCGSPLFGDGNDLADQTASTLADAITNGWVTLPLWICDHMQDTPVGATYITVHILDHPVGACCVGQSPNIECRITSSTACADQGGTYIGDTTVCDPFPCLVPVRETTWGKLKSLYH